MSTHGRAMSGEGPSLVGDVMNTRPVVIGEDADLWEATNLIAISRVNDLMVIAADGRFVGILAEGDILRNALPDRDEILAAGGSVEDGYRLFLRRGSEMSAEPIRPLVITSPVEVGPDDHVAKVATVFVERAIRTVAVTSGDVLIGTLSRADICRALVAW